MQVRKSDRCLPFSEQLSLTGWAALLGFCAPAAFAQQACPPTAVWQQANVAQLTAWTEVCDDNAFFHAHRGALLLAQGDTEAAAVALEKALLLNPDLPGAQLDFAQALAQIGLKGSARAMLSEVLQRSDIQPDLKAQLSAIQGAGVLSNTPRTNNDLAKWSTMVQSVYGRESNLNSATYTDVLTLYLSNGPITLGLNDNVKPEAGTALKTTLAAQGALQRFGGQEISMNVAFSSKTGAANVGGNNQTAEGALKYSLPILAGKASGAWQVALGGTQFWLGNQTAYSDQGVQLKYAFDSLGGFCKMAPAVGRIDQTFPQSSSLNGRYTYGRLDLMCEGSSQQETHIAFGGGVDHAQDAIRPGGDRVRTDLLLRHEQIVTVPVLPFGPGQLSAWVRYAHSQDKQAYSDLLGDLKSNTHRTDLGLGFWTPIAKQWRVGVNLEATSQKSNNALFNLKNSSFYVGLRWANE